MKRLLFLVHRWVGLVLALFMSLWFLTGLVIIYSTQMTQTRVQQQAHGEALLPAADWLSLGEAWQRSAIERKASVSGKPGVEQGGASKQTGKRDESGGIGEARLVRQGGQPVWLVDDSGGRRFAVSAIDGGLRETSAELALKIAEQWVNVDAGAVATPVSYLETVDKPLILRNQDALRPFHRIAVADGAGGELLVSARSGEVVHASSRFDRGMYWAGNWLHLFRFLDSAGLGEVRTDVLAWCAFSAVLACLTGLIIGWLRWRPGWLGKPTYSQGRTQPYRAFWSRWHFWSGLLGGTLALAWALSGYLNNNPWQIFSPATPSRDELVRYLGSGLTASMSDWKPRALGDDAGQVVELAWRRLGSEAVLLAYDRSGERRPLEAASRQFDNAALVSAVQRLAKVSATATPVLQSEYDRYYYPRHGRGSADRPLPILRVDLNDSAGTRFYLDPQDGRLLLRQDQSRRIYRWLYSALHHWDFGWLYQRPVWDAWMLTWVGFGLVLSISSLVLGWKLLVFTFRSKKHAGSRTRPASVLAPESQAG